MRMESFQRAVVLVFLAMMHRRQEFLQMFTDSTYYMLGLKHKFV